MTNASDLKMETLISLCADDNNFDSIVSNIQSLYNYLQHNSSTQCEDEYLRLMSHLLENYLDAAKKSFLRQHLSKMIARQTKDNYAAQYFKQRFAQAKIFDLLKHHRNLTKKRLVLTNINYESRKFKIKVC